MKLSELLTASPFLYGALFCPYRQALAANLPTGITGPEIDQLIEKIGFPSSTRLLRAADPYPAWPGVRIGVDVSISPQASFQIGDKNGSEPNVFVLPRIHFTKGLWKGAELIFSTLPITEQPGYAATGGILKWCLYQEKEGWLSVSAFTGYTNVSAFRGDYNGNNFEFGFYASKDYVRLKPYVGGSVMLAQGGIRPSLAKTPVTSSMKSTLHAFIGIELEYPVTFAGQFSLFNLNPSFSLFVGKRF